MKYYEYHVGQLSGLYLSYLKPFLQLYSSISFEFFMDQESETPHVSLIWYNRAVSTSKENNRERKAK